VNKHLYLCHPLVLSSPTRVEVLRTCLLAGLIRLSLQGMR